MFFLSYHTKGPCYPHNITDNAKLEEVVFEKFLHCKATVSPFPYSTLWKQVQPTFMKGVYDFEFLYKKDLYFSLYLFIQCKCFLDCKFFFFR